MEESSAVSLQANGPAVWAFVAYLAVVIGIGIWASRFSSRGMGAFFLAGRSLNRWVVALSAVASGRSSWLMVGLTGLAFVRGASALWAAVGYIVVEFLLFWFYGPRLRRFSERHDCLTVPDFFAARFDDDTTGTRVPGLLRALLVVVLMLFIPTYVGAQFKAGGTTFATAFDVSFDTGLWLTAAIVLVYTVTGGFLAVSMTDMLQSGFMVVGLVVLPIVVILDLGGLAATFDALALQDATLTDPMAITWGVLIGFLGIGLGSPGNPHILVRYMSIRDPAQLRASAVVGTVWNALMAGGALFIGLVGRAVYTSVDNLPDASRENLYPALSEMYLSPVVFGLVIASIFAAIMSTTDSQLLVAASGVVRDVYEKILRRGHTVSETGMVTLSRVVIVVMVLAAVVLAQAEDTVFWFVLLAWAGLGAAFGPTSLLALYWKRTTRSGVVAGVLAGTFAVFLWEFGGNDELLGGGALAWVLGVHDAVAASLAQVIDWLAPLLSWIPWRPWLDGRDAGLGAVTTDEIAAWYMGLYELVPGFGIGLVVTIVVSLVTPRPKGVDAMFDAMAGTANP